MSETSKATDTAKKAQDHAARSASSAADATARMTKESAQDSNVFVQTAAARIKDVGQTMADSVVETAKDVTDISSKAAEHGAGAMFIGMRTAADVGGRVADLGFGRGHHLMSSTAHAMDMYRDASERSAHQVQALFSSAISFGRGIQQLQQAWLEMVDHSMENAAHKPQDLLRCRTIVEVAEVQRDLYVDAVNYAFESTSRLLELTSRTAQEAMRPLQSHRH